ncbi:NAD(P)/FAD-dependent oxidoreductase [Sphingobium sp. EP60837]|uniref:NAD(P)/FAD-dependent oxidoreductase n=1 Tax=Sphingobium sp. EP60837 TaxID=1855519 RepID=UPI0007DD3783|nr:FAD-binding oxidoreductase [Sphingobium sp. EP60837]ANI79255.1 putative oxidoreductase OrdL [Sphingobium sp. EP60837]
MTAQHGSYRPVSGWLEQPPVLQPELDGEVTADVVVVGAGFAGLSTALELASTGANVVILEQHFAGFGASGRNAGYLGGGHGLEHDLFLKRVGMDQARKIIRFYQTGVSYVEEKLDKLGIDCDYRATGNIKAGIHPSQEKKLRHNMQVDIELGAPAQFLDRGDMRARGIPPAFQFGYLMNNGGTLDPGKYVMGLRRTAIAAGVRLYENSALLSYSDGATITCYTAKGRVHARFLVFATNAFTPQLGLLQDKIATMRVSAIETEPLSPEQLSSLGWPNREGIITSHLVMESHRLTERNSLVITTKRLRYMRRGQTPNVPDERAYRALTVALRDRFPTLNTLGVKFCWSGYISFAHDALPVVGETGAQQNIFYTAGCSGHGVGTQSFIGRLLADRIRGAENEHLAALRHKTPSVLPEPLEWGVMSSVLGAAHKLDDWVNRKARSSAKTARAG